MSENLNLIEWKAMENHWANSLAEGSNVEVKVTTIYNGSNKPIRFRVVQRIDGKETVLNFRN